MIIFVPLIILVVGSFMAKEIFWDSFLWRYFWAPVVADAEREPVNGISAGYNIVNTIIYGIILVISFFGIIELIRHFDISINKKFVYTLLPWVILGGSLRSLEDAGLFKSPLDKFMITPMIYFVLGFSAVFLMLIGAHLSRIEWDTDKSKYMGLLILTPLPFFYLFLGSFIEPFFISFIVVVLLFLSLTFLIGLIYLDLDEKYLFFTYGTTLLSISLSYNVYIILFRDSANPLEVVIITMLGSILTFLFLGFFWISGRVSLTGFKREYFEIFSRPLNLLICWAHLFDASSTYRGVTAFGYAEKHVLPEFLIEYTGPEILFVVKIVLILVVIYVLDILLEEDFSEDESLRSFLKFVIIVLGTAPAVRNTLRLAMGV
ncbi:MAG: DUF63 family protein [Candidatus Thermoplasmatota archaeon]|nr:DUF63 family protein [Candidatus Thermoplasmatota archaeon]